MRRRCLYKYFQDRRWAERLLEGKLLFRSLAYFRDYKDGNIREDDKEGTAVFRPEGGLVINNLTQGTTSTLRNSAFESSARQEEIFVYCTSRSLSDELRERFEADCCVEIADIAAFCRRVQEALPTEATFPGPAGRTRLGQRVQSYAAAEGGSPRWALPDVIATSKLNGYAWQDEFRLVFTLTNAFDFENVETKLMLGQPKRMANPVEHRTHLVEAGSLRDICKLHEL